MIGMWHGERGMVVLVEESLVNYFIRQMGLRDRSESE